MCFNIVHKALQKLVSDHLLIFVSYVRTTEQYAEIRPFIKDFHKPMLNDFTFPLYCVQGNNVFCEEETFIATAFSLNLMS